jgi:hypothetical protein
VRRHPAQDDPDEDREKEQVEAQDGELNDRRDGDPQRVDRGADDPEEDEHGHELDDERDQHRRRVEAPYGGHDAPHTYNPITALVATLSEPVLRPFRRTIPSIGGLDISPVFALILVQAVVIFLHTLKPIPV